MESNSESSVFSQPPEEMVSSPVRPSGFVALVLGGLSSVVLLSTALLIVPIFAVAVGLWALRPVQEGVPLGRRFAMLGILLAVFFASWGVVGDSVRSRELSRNGERFATQWLQLGGVGEWEAAIELMKSPAARQSPQMPLKAYYANSEERVEEMEVFMERVSVQRIIDAGENARWKLSGSPLVYEEHGVLCVQLHFVDDNRGSGDGVRLELQRLWDPVGHQGEWKVRDFGAFTKSPS